MRELFARWATDNPAYLEPRATEGNRATEPPNPRHSKGDEASASPAHPVLVWATEGNLAPVAQVAHPAAAWATAATVCETQENQAIRPQIALVAPVAHASSRSAALEEPDGDDADAWQVWVARITANWRARGWPREQAYRFAWGHAENVWRERHGVRPGPHRCAGCGEGLDPDAARQFAEGVYIHDHGEGDDLRCQLAYGRQWRGAARAVLVAMGLTAPEPQEDED